ncbi:PAS-domain containing protein [Azospira restricta]|uniref:histidine kinase n=1 Tax=Azospira restricta TaxID=404405 RepID=A0A974SQI1_9RHOO|nr:PAS-domain containing protein [Azospira restricta]QRJ64529.1 PAS-domain containing protein [Azospira restricta]
MATSQQFDTLAASDLIAAAEYMPIGVSIVDERLRVKFWNRAFLDILDFPEALLRVGMPLAELFRYNAERGEYGSGDIDELVAARVALAQRFEPHHFLRKRPDGHFIDIRGEVIRKDDGTVGGFVSLYQDVTREKTFEQELVESNRALGEGNAKLQRAYEELRETELQLLQSAKMASVGQLAAGIAHEINNPIGFVMSNQSALKRNAETLVELADAYSAREAALPAVEREALARLKREMDIDFIKEDMPQLFDEMRTGLDRVKQIVASLQTFAEDRSGTWEDTDLSCELDRALAVAQHRLPAGAQIVRDYAPLPPIRAMRADLTQVLLALLHNAGDAIGGGGTITLRCGEDGDKVFVEVADNGCGIAEQVMPHLFDPFFTTKPVGSGTGLSLAVSQRVVRNHGGRILVRSEPGKGSVFRVELPKSPSSPAHAGTPA